MLFPCSHSATVRDGASYYRNRPSFRTGTERRSAGKFHRQCTSVGTDPPRTPSGGAFSPRGACLELFLNRYSPGRPFGENRMVALLTHPCCRFVVRARECHACRTAMGTRSLSRLTALRARLFSTRLRCCCCCCVAVVVVLVFFSCVCLILGAFFVGSPFFFIIILLVGSF